MDGRVERSLREVDRLERVGGDIGSVGGCRLSNRRRRCVGLAGSVRLFCGWGVAVGRSRRGRRGRRGWGWDIGRRIGCLGLVVIFLS